MVAGCVTESLASNCNDQSCLTWVEIYESFLRRTVLSPETFTFQEARIT